MVHLCHVFWALKRGVVFVVTNQPVVLERVDRVIFF